ncbi:MAG: ERF family protein [Lachnospiraceae bacterium]|nr:ERF family protein [Lachnospiraceae bacterium]
MKGQERIRSQSFIKAATYSDKYCLMKMYKVQTGDDPDANASGELKNRTRKNPDAAPEVPATITEKEQNILKEMCAKAGKDISKV